MESEIGFRFFAGLCLPAIKSLCRRADDDDIFSLAFED